MCEVYELGMCNQSFGSEEKTCARSGERQYERMKHDRQTKSTECDWVYKLMDLHARAHNPLRFIFTLKGRSQTHLGLIFTLNGQDYDDNAFACAYVRLHSKIDSRMQVNLKCLMPIIIMLFWPVLHGMARHCCWKRNAESHSEHRFQCEIANNHALCSQHKDDRSFEEKLMWFWFIANFGHRTGISCAEQRLAFWAFRFTNHT